MVLQIVAIMKSEIPEFQTEEPREKSEVFCKTVATIGKFSDLTVGKTYHKLCPCEPWTWDFVPANDLISSGALLCDMQKEPKVNSAVFVRQFSLTLPSDHYLILFGSLFILREPFVTCG